MLLASRGLATPAVAACTASTSQGHVGGFFPANREAKVTLATRWIVFQTGILKMHPITWDSGGYWDSVCVCVCVCVCGLGGCACVTYYAMF